MRIRTEFVADCTAAIAWRALHDPSVAAGLYAPLLVMRPEGQFPAVFETGMVVRVQLRLLGLVPVGEQEIRITDVVPDSFGWPRTMRDDGMPLRGILAGLTHWHHEISVAPVPGSSNRALWTDEVRIGGRGAGALRWPLAVMWRWRGWKLRRLARRWPR